MGAAEGRCRLQGAVPMTSSSATSSSACCLTQCATALPTVLTVVMKPTAVPGAGVWGRQVQGRDSPQAPSAGSGSAPKPQGSQHCMYSRSQSELVPLWPGSSLILHLLSGSANPRAAEHPCLSTGCGGNVTGLRGTFSAPSYPQQYPHHQVGAVLPWGRWWAGTRAHGRCHFVLQEAGQQAVMHRVHSPLSPTN